MVADENGEWTCILPVDDGDHSFTAVATDETGTDSEPSPAIDITVDTEAPGEPDITVANGDKIAGTVPEPVEEGTTVTVTDANGDPLPGCEEIPVDENGNWSCDTPTTITEDTTITAVAKDEAGNESDPIEEPLDVTAPEVEITKANEDEISGTVDDPDSTVKVTYPTADGPKTVDATVNPDGTWSIDPTDVVDGPITVVATDKAGNDGSASGEIDATDPGPVTIDEANATHVTGKVDEPLDEPTTVTITWPDGSKSGPIEVGPDGEFEFETPAGMPSGDITVVATDPVGNTSQATERLDTDPDGAPDILVANKTEVSGQAPEGYTPGSTIVVEWPDGTTSEPITIEDDGSWRIDTPEGMDSGTVKARVVDPAGNVSEPGTAPLDTVNPGTPTIDKANDKVIEGTVPQPVDEGTTVTITYPIDDQGGTNTVTVEVDEDGKWSTPTPVDAIDGEISAQAEDPAGNLSGVATAELDRTPPAMPDIDVANGTEISGTVDPGTVDEETTVTVTDEDGNVLCTAEVDETTGAWSCLTPDSVTEDTVIKAVATDKAGNDSEPAEKELDVTAPLPPTIDVANGTEISGTSEYPGTVTVTYPKEDGTTGEITVDVEPDGTWTVETPSDAKDSGEIKAVATDPAGNVSDPAREILDKTPPEKPVVNPSNGSEISGKAEPGGKVTVTDEDGDPVPGCEDVAVDDQGNWSCRPTTPLEPGDIVTVTVKDPAGNVSEPVELTISELGIMVAYDERHRLETQIVTGSNFNAGEEVCLVVYSDPMPVGCMEADADGAVTFEFTVPQDFEVGTHTVELAGAQSGKVSTTFQVLADIEVKTGGSVLPTDNMALYGLVSILMISTIGVALGIKQRQTC